MFPGATADRDDARYVVLGAPLDATTTFYPGTRFGPELIRHHARHFDDYDHLTASSFSELGVADVGDVDAWDDIEAYLEFLQSELTGIVLDDAIPLVLGGEHTVTLAGVQATAADTLVVLDAHLDLRDTYHDNPLNHATVVRRALETVDQVTILGGRTGAREEWDRASAADVDVVAVDDVADWDPPTSGNVFLSVDIDAFDPGFAPGTGTLEPGGLAPPTGLEVVSDVAPRCVGMDVVEVSDRDNGQTATLAGKLLRRFVYDHAASD